MQECEICGEEVETFTCRVCGRVFCIDCGDPAAGECEFCTEDEE